MKKMRQTLALLLAGALTVGSFAGCGGSKAGGETAGTETAGTEAAGTAASGSDTPLVIANDGMSEKFSPFFAESVPDQNIVDVTQISLVYNDRPVSLSTMVSRVRPLRTTVPIILTTDRPI